MYCPECGHKLEERANFCPECGTSIPRTDHVAIVAAVPAAPAVDSRQGEGSKLPVIARQANSPQLPGGPQPHADRRTATSPRRSRTGVSTMLLSILALFVIVPVELASLLLASILGWDSDLCVTVGNAAGAVVALLIIGGRCLLEPHAKAFATALREGWWLLATCLGLLAYDLVGTITVGEFVLVPGWAMRIVSLVVLCAAIGIGEEAIFRGLLMHGLLAPLGKSRRGIWIAVLVGVLLFGLAHIDWWSTDFADPLSVLQALLKIVQVGILGFFLSALALRTNSLMGAALLHALNDFILMVEWVGLMGESTAVEYVSTGEDALPTIVLYLVIIVLYLPLLVKGIRMIRQLPSPNRGAFFGE